MKAEGYLIRFGEINEDGNVITKEAISMMNIESLKQNGMIKDAVIDEIGVKIIYDIK